jgi:predicted negative regulator of RcsB-dependent stress response
MQKGVSTLTGFIIIVVEMVILFGGVFAYQYFTMQSINNIPQVQNGQQ